MHDVPLDDEHVRVAGVFDLERTGTGIVPRRLPAWTRQQIVTPTMLVLPNMLTGARLELDTEATALELDVELTLLQTKGEPILPAGFDLVVDGEVREQHRTTEGTLIVMDRARAPFDLVPGGPPTVGLGPL